MSDKIENQINALIDALRTREQEEKKRYDEAIDIDDMNEAKVVMLDAREKIHQLRKWSENLVDLHEEIVGSFLSIDDRTEYSSQIETYDNVEPALQDISELDATLLSGKVPEQITLMGKTIPVNNWDDVLVILCEEMAIKRPYKTLSIGVKEILKIGEQPALWLDERSESDEVCKLSNGLSVVKNRTSEEIISCCQRMLSLCGYDCNQLKIS